MFGQHVSTDAGPTVEVEALKGSFSSEHAKLSSVSCVEESVQPSLWAADLEAIANNSTAAIAAVAFIVLRQYRYNNLRCQSRTSVVC